MYDAVQFPTIFNFGNELIVEPVPGRFAYQATALKGESYVRIVCQLSA